MSYPGDPWSYRIIYEENREKFLDLFIKGTPISRNPPLESFTLSQSLDPAIIRVKIADSLEKEWPSRLTYKRLLGAVTLQAYNYRYRKITETGIRGPLVSYLSLQSGTYVIMRNGSDISQYNFAIADLKNRKFYFRQSVAEVISCLKILDSKTKDLPLCLGDDLSQVNLTLLERRMKA